MADRASMVRERLLSLGLLQRSSAERLGSEGWSVETLLRLGHQGELVGGLLVALDVKPDELWGSLCLTLGGSALKAQLADVRSSPFYELIVAYQGRQERWAGEALDLFVERLNDLLRTDPQARAVAILGEWEDALVLWCVDKSHLPKLLRQDFFQPQNRSQLAGLIPR